jgi:apolipoprotein N-acyltransferase
MGLAFLAGVAAVAGMAPFNLWPVLILALAALFMLTDDAARGPRGVRLAAWTGWAFGFGYFGAGLYWIGEAFFVDPDTIWMMPFSVTLLPAGLALFHAAACAIAAAIPRRGAGGAFVLTASLGAVEFVRGFIFTGFPWNLFGSTFVDTPIAQAAAIGGVYGLTLLALLAGFSLPPVFRQAGRLRFLPFATAITLLAAAWLYGELHRAAYAQLPKADLTRIRVVQPDNPQSEKGRPDYLRRLWERLVELTGRPGADAVDVFIWPEGVIPFLDESPEAMAAMGALLRPGQILIAGSARREIGDDRTTRYYNALLVIDHNGIALDVYDKAHLVPFGEYLPFPDAFRALDIDSLTARIGGAFTAGPGRRTIRADGVPAFSPLICYEILFPAEAADHAGRPDWIANITDDSWFGTQTGPHQHLTAARFRAIEEGLPVVRSATTGISAVIDAVGDVVAARPLQTADSFDADLPNSFTPTLFSRYAHFWFMLLLVGALLAGLALRRRK